MEPAMRTKTPKPTTRLAAATRACRSLLASSVLAVVSAGSLGAAPPADIDWRFQPAETVLPVTAPQPGTGTTSLSLDDGTAEGSFGVSAAGGSNAKQFFWFNQFALGADPIVLGEVQVLFRPGTNLAVDDDVQIVVFHDPDGDPTNGATLIASRDEVIQALDGTTFSTYVFAPGFFVPGGGDLLVGVVSRFVESGVTGPAEPAAIDTTASQGRSWVAIWNADPPAIPDLPPDQLLDLIDVFVPGNWMIRASAAPGSSEIIPTLDQWGLGLLILLLAGFAVLRLRR